MPVKYLILNGPPSSGKTTIAREIVRVLGGRGKIAVQDSFAAPMKHFIATALGERYQQMNKEKARPELNGASVRDFLIDLSQNYMKVKYGDDIFGRWLMHRTLRDPVTNPDYVVVDDGGFAPEIEAVTNRTVIRVVRPGCSFARDSRGYVQIFNYPFINDGDMTSLWMQCEKIVSGLE